MGAVFGSAPEPSTTPASVVDDPPAPAPWYCEVIDRYTGQKLDPYSPAEAMRMGYFIAALPLSGSPMDKLFADGRDIIETYRLDNSPAKLTLNKDGTYNWEWDYYEGAMGYDFEWRAEESGKFAAAEVEPGKFRISYSDSVWTSGELGPHYPERASGVGQAPNHLQPDVVFLDNGVIKLEKGPTPKDMLGPGNARGF